MESRHDDAHWAAYNAGQRDRPVRPLCRMALTLAGPGQERPAVDLGCGAGVENRALLAAGWRVHAVDREPGTRQRVMAATVGQPQERLTIITSGFDQLRELPAAGLVYAGYSLPYLDPEDFRRVWSLVRAAVRPGGWFAGNFFGERDSWASAPGETYLSGKAVLGLVEGWEVVHWVEEDEDGQAWSGLKHWHLFDVIARRPLATGSPVIDRAVDRSHRTSLSPLIEASAEGASQSGGRARRLVGHVPVESRTWSKQENRSSMTSSHLRAAGGSAALLRLRRTAD